MMRNMSFSNDAMARYYYRKTEIMNALQKYLSDMNKGNTYRWLKPGFIANLDTQEIFMKLETSEVDDYCEFYFSLQISDCSYYSYSFLRLRLRDMVIWVYRK